MGRSPCCEKVGLKKGPWVPEEDQKLLAYIQEHGHGSWRALPAKAGLQRCGKSCRLRWTNYLRPDIKRGKFSIQEEQTIIQLHALLGNRWSAIATHLPKRTDNEIKNYWNTHLKKRLTKMGIDPVTHKPKNETLSSVDGQHKDSANLVHMAQWESARLEAEARLVRESKIRSTNTSFRQQLGSSGSGSGSAQLLNKMATQPAAQALCLDVLKAWQVIRSKTTNEGTRFGDLESPTSTLSFSDNSVPIQTRFKDSSASGYELVGSSSPCGRGTVKEEGADDWEGHGKSATNFPHDQYNDEKMVENSVAFPSNLKDVAGFTVDDPWAGMEPSKIEHEHEAVSHFGDGFTELLLGNTYDSRSPVNDGVMSGKEEYEENKNYWNSILDLVNSSPSESPGFLE